MTTPQTTPDAPEAMPSIPPRYQHTYCQRCGLDCGPGDDGPIDCRGHAHLSGNGAPQPLAVPPGYALVPLEPTPEMLAATDIEDTEYYFHSMEGARAFLAAHYRAMVAVAPQPPASALPLAVGAEEHCHKCQTPIHCHQDGYCGNFGRKFSAPPPLSPPDTGNVGATWSCSRCGAKSVQACNENGCFLGENEPQPVAWIVHTKEGDLLVDYPAERYGSENPRTPLFAALPPPGRGMVPMTEEQRLIAPWPDFLGQPIRHGDRLLHPANGDEFVAIRLKGFESDGDAWRAVYDDATVSRLCLQIGDKGRAVLADRPAHGIKEGS